MQKIKINIFAKAVLILSVALFAHIESVIAATILSVPFTSQAPAGNWAQPWQDFCEEASVVMAAHFLWNKPLTPKLADMEMQIIRQYEGLVLKKYKDTSVTETASILINLFGFKNIRTRMVSSASDIKEELAQGNLVIIPAAGRILKNPYFKLPGPLYHMLVVRGFDDARKTFIVNDPGTRYGNGYAYNQDVLMNAIHDWNGGDVLRGEKDVIIVGR